MDIMDISGFCKYGAKSAFVRIIAQKLPKEQAEKARKRKKRKASKNQYRITEETLFCAGWMVVITSLEIEYSGEEILYLYRSRWQVELLFKRFKQNFAVTAIKAEEYQLCRTGGSFMAYHMDNDRTAGIPCRVLYRRKGRGGRDLFYL